MSIKVVDDYQKTIRCIICLEDYYISSPFSSSSSSSTLLQTTAGSFDNPSLYTLNGCYHPICEPCLGKYTINTLEERTKNSLAITRDSMKFINCPFPECNQTYSMNAIITKVLPFRHRLAIWWRQFMLNKSSSSVSLQKLKSNSMSTTTTTTTTTLANNVIPITETRDKSDKKKFNTTTTSAAAATTDGVQKRLSKEFLKLALEEGWTRCPNCKYFVERREGCRHIKCRCGIQFCYLCGTQFCKKDSCYKNRDNLHAELQLMR